MQHCVEQPTSKREKQQSPAFATTTSDGMQRAQEHTTAGTGSRRAHFGSLLVAHYEVLGHLEKQEDFRGAQHLLHHASTSSFSLTAHPISTLPTLHDSPFRSHCLNPLLSAATSDRADQSALVRGPCTAQRDRGAALLSLSLIFPCPPLCFHEMCKKQEQQHGNPVMIRSQHAHKTGDVI